MAARPFSIDLSVRWTPMVSFLPPKEHDEPKRLASLT